MTQPTLRPKVIIAETGPAAGVDRRYGASARRPNRPAATFGLAGPLSATASVQLGSGLQGQAELVTEGECDEPPCRAS